MDVVQVKKTVILTARACYRSVCRHPFFVGIVLFLFLLYRSSPFMFSFFVSASPILVSTAVLLGTLLSLGQPNIPEIEKEEERNHGISSLQTRVPSDDTVFERDGSYSVERYTDVRRVQDKSIEEASSTPSSSSDVGKSNILADSEPLIDKKSRDFQFEKWETQGESESCDIVFESKSELNELKEGHGEVPVNLHTPVQQSDERSLNDLGNANSPEAYFGDKIVDWTFPPGSPRKHLDGGMSSEDYVGADALDRSSPPDSPSKHEEEGEEEEGEEEDDEESDSESDGAESSSPDASMADIIPLLDELHPLLDEDAPHHVHMSSERSDAESENSSESASDGTNELHEDMENRENGIEAVADYEEEEESRVENTDEDKSAIRWTDDDQKNLMDLGTSELERNQRLENLIARRRLRKSMKIMAEKNLIDFDSADLPFNIAHISTARRSNPFDLPYDDDMGLPPMPGSAPSVLLPRRNPFDLPYDSSEEKPDLMSDDFHQDVMGLQSKESVFRRNETFNVGPSLFGASRYESKFIPYFLPDRMTSEEYTSFNRQSSDISDSKVSYMPETESASSDDDLEEKKPTEEELLNEPKVTSIAELDFSSIREHPFEHVAHGSESSEDEDSLDLGQGKIHDDTNDFEVNLIDLEDYQDQVPSFSSTTAEATSMKYNESEAHTDTEALEAKVTSSSSISEVDKEIYAEEGGDNAEKGDEQLLIPKPFRGNSMEDSAISYQLSMGKSGIDSTSHLVVDTAHKEPVYDSSPTALEKNFSSSSISSDLQLEKSGTSSPPALVPTTMSFTEKYSDIVNESIVNITPATEVNEKLVSAHDQVPSEEHLSQSEEGLSLSDQSVNKLSSTNPEEQQESTNYLIDIEFQQLDNKIHQIIDPFETLEPLAMSSEAKEVEAPGADLKNVSTFDGHENDEKNQVLEHHTFPVEGNITPDNMQNNVEDLDDVDEIDDGLLLELDTVGDFSVIGLSSNLNDSGGETFHKLHDFGNSSEDVKDNIGLSRVTLEDEENLKAMVEKELTNTGEEMEEASAFQRSGEHFDLSTGEFVHARVVDLFDSKISNDKPLPEEASAEPADSNIVQNPKAGEISSDSTVKVQTTQDNEFSYKEAEPMPERMKVSTSEFVHIELVDPFDSKISNDKPLTEETDAEPANSNIVQNSKAREISSESPLEVQATQDEFSFKKAEPISEEMNIVVGELEIHQDLFHAETKTGMQLIEAHSLVDVPLALGQVNENESDKQYAVDPVQTTLSPDETVAQYFQHEMLHEVPVPLASKSDLAIHESILVQDDQSAVEEHAVERLVLHGINGDNHDFAEPQYHVGTILEVHVDKTRSEEDTNAVEVKVNEVSEAHDFAEPQYHVGTISEVHVDKTRAEEDTNAVELKVNEVSEANIEKSPMTNSEIETAELKVNEAPQTVTETLPNTNPAIESGESKVDEECSSKAIESSSKVSDAVAATSDAAEQLPKERETSEDLKQSDVKHKKSTSHTSSSSSSSGSSSSDSDGE